MYGISDNQFQEEKGRIDGQQDHDTRRLGEPHDCGGIGVQAVLSSELDCISG